jgi:LysR family nitrogen assimilation transcriptional regulator
MESRQLRYFSEIAEAGSFTAAAARLHIAQPALSRQVAALEKELGTALFLREPGGVRLTEAGHILQRHADAIRVHTARAREEISASIGEESVWLSLGTNPSIGKQIFGVVAERMTSQYPRLRLSFVEGVGAQLLASVADGTVDLAITSRPAYSPGIEFELLFSEPVYLVAAPGKPVPETVSDWESLGGLPLVVTNQQTTIASWVEELSGLARTTLDLRFRVESASAAMDIVRRGLAYGVLPRSTLTEAGSGKQLQKVRMQSVVLERQLAWSRNRDRSTAFNSLRHAVIEEIQNAFPIEAGVD